MRVAIYSPTVIAVMLFCPGSFVSGQTRPSPDLGSGIHLSPERRDEAIKYIRLADPLAKDPNDLVAMAAGFLAEAEARLGDVSAAKRRITQRHHSFTTVSGMVQIAGIQFEHGDKAGAKSTLEEATPMAEEEDDFAELSAARAGLGDIDGALAAAERVKDPDRSAEVSARLGVAQFRSNRIADAEASFKKAIALVAVADGQHSRFRRPWKVVSIARSQIACGDADGAEQTLSQVSSPWF
jgi:tetratricopeptide (TPR) repeat protein